jgi:translation elongation factor EF-1alpha
VHTVCPGATAENILEAGDVLIKVSETLPVCACLHVRVRVFTHTHTHTHHTHTHITHTHTQTHTHTHTHTHTMVSGVRNSPPASSFSNSIVFNTGNMDLTNSRKAHEFLAYEALSY